MLEAGFWYEKDILDREQVKFGSCSSFCDYYAENANIKDTQFIICNFDGNLVIKDCGSPDYETEIEEEGKWANLSKK